MPGAMKARLVSHHEDYTVGQTTGGLSVFFTILCIIDLFGVFPVIALPKPIIACGIYGVPLVLSVFGLQLYTAVLLGRCWILAQELAPRIGEKNRYPYAAVAELAFGRRARQLIVFLIDATVFGAGVPNLLVASQSLQLFWWKITGGGVGVSFCVWMVVLGLLLCPVMWLGSPKDMKPLALGSVCIVATVAVAVWCCILQDTSSPAPSPGQQEMRPDLRAFLVAYGIIAFQFDIHPMLLTIQVDMKNGSKINTAVLGGFLATGFMFAVTSFLAAYRYGKNVDSNILQGIPPSVPLFVVALLVALQLCLSSAVGNSALFQHVEDLLRVPRDFCVQRCLIRSGIVALAVFLGESVPRFDLVMGLVGSTLTGPLMFIFPPLFFLKLCRMKSKTAVDKISLLPKNNIEKRGAIVSNGRSVNHVIQNGVSSAILISACHSKYKTFTDSFVTDYSPDEYRIKWYDVVTAFSVMVLGVAATLVATYSNWSDTLNSANFSPPCLVNATAAARNFLQVSKGT